MPGKYLCYYFVRLYWHKIYGTPFEADGHVLPNVFDIKHCDVIIISYLFNFVQSMSVESKKINTYFHIYTYDFDKN